MTHVSLKTGAPTKDRLNALTVLLFEGEKPPADLNELCDGGAARAKKLGDFKGDKGQTTVLYGKGKTERVVLAGLGPRGKAGAEAVRMAVGAAVRAVRKLKLTTVGFQLPAKLPKGLYPAQVAAAIAEAAVLADYHYDRWGSRKAEAPSTLKVSVYGPASAKHAVNVAVAVAESANLARDLANEPGNYGTPKALAAAARKAGKSYGFSVKVLEPAAMKRLGMGGLLGVAKGSNEPPRFIEMVYTPKKRAKGSGTVCLVGKGLTFDSGGISIKPAANMWEMKFDKCGGCAVIGAMAAVARAKLPIKVVGLVPSTENMPGGGANKPGDVLTALNGKTIEVLNTDAEGRLILADALAYSARFKPDAIVDLATLTGSVVVALGKVRAGLMTVDAKLETALRAAGEATGEKLWPLPMDDEYGEQVKSEVADVKNLGRGREAGSIAGGWFLRNFVPEGIPWAHLDIAGTAWNSSDPGKGYIGRGGTGFGVRLIFEFLRQRAGA